MKYVLSSQIDVNSELFFYCRYFFDRHRAYKPFTVEAYPIKQKRLFLLTHDMQVSKLRFGSDRIDLAHVAALVLLLDIVYVQEPRPVLVMSDTYPRVAGYHMGMDSQDGGLLEVHPRYLRAKRFPISYGHRGYSPAVYVSDKEFFSDNLRALPVCDMGKVCKCGPVIQTTMFVRRLTARFIPELFGCFSSLISLSELNV